MLPLVIKKSSSNEGMIPILKNQMHMNNPLQAQSIPKLQSYTSFPNFIDSQSPDRKFDTSPLKNPEIMQ